MKPSKENEWIDQVISEIAGQDKPTPNFTQWCQEHSKSIHTLQSCSRQHFLWGDKMITTPQIIWRTIMKTQITKFATALLIITAIVVSIIFLGKSTPAVYAIEQTIEANRIMRSLHLKYFDSSHDDVAKECWLELDESGQPKNVRINWSEWMAGGEKVVWNQEKTIIWNKKQGILHIFDDEIYTARILALTSKENPRRSVERFYELKKKGEAKVDIREPANKSKPVIVTVTGLGKNINRYVLSVDQATKLVTRIISIGEPYTYESPHKDVFSYLLVPCVVEVEIQGKTFTRPMSPLIRQVLGRRERWMVHGLAPTSPNPKTEKIQK